MSGTIFVNLPVQDLARSTRFYQKLGFKKDARFSSDEASCMVWSNEIKFMLLARPFYSYFIDDKTIADTHKTSAALLCLTLDSEKAVTKFVTAARRNGGRAYQVTLPDMPDMTGYEVEDPTVISSSRFTCRPSRPRANCRICLPLLSARCMKKGSRMLSS